MADREGRIPESAFKIGVGVLYGTAILVASMRTALRIHFQRRLCLDDAFLLLACAALTAAVPILYRAIGPLYFLQEFASGGPSATTSSQSTGSNVNAEVHRYKLLHMTYEALVWTAIFAVKFSFLSFFRHIVDRIPSLMLHWKVVGVVNIVACAFCVCFSFMTCPLTGYTAIQCAYGSGFTREAAIAWAATALDRITDILIVGIPVRVLWRVRIRARQKLGIGVFLSLSIVMIIIACIRGLGFISFYHAYSWYLFWLQIEGSVAVIMVSLTAFCSVFATQGSGGRERKARPWYSSTVARLRRHKAPSARYNLEDLPAIPSATLTGMRTFIRGGRLGNGLETNEDLIGYETMNRGSAGEIKI